MVLAGGFSKRFGQDKGLVELAGKPLVLHVLDRMFARAQVCSNCGKSCFGAGKLGFAVGDRLFEGCAVCFKDGP